ncbi:CRISPR-associated endonuclease Cas2 [Candidatus Poribacteria bacterium]|nr:CRISPR-associated endonuclease Cas2 [Candidatus Poribacteria bacterium]
MHYTIAYDITEDKRRNKVAKILKDFGKRVQYSVFECNIDKLSYLRLHDRLGKAMDMDEDTITFYHICAACEKQIERIGLDKELENDSYIV